MNEVTLKHIRQAAEWARRNRDAGLMNEELCVVQCHYNQRQWSCGTAYCIWGIANLLAGNGKVTEGPGCGWWEQSSLHGEVETILSDAYGRPEEVLELLKGVE